MNDSLLVEGVDVWIANTAAVLGWFWVFDQHLRHTV